MRWLAVLLAVAPPPCGHYATPRYLGWSAPNCEIGGLRFQFNPGYTYTDQGTSNGFVAALLPAIDFDWTQQGNTITMTLSSTLQAIAQAEARGPLYSYARSRWSASFDIVATNGIQLTSADVAYNLLRTTAGDGLAVYGSQMTPGLSGPLGVYGYGIETFVGADVVGEGSADLSGSWSYVFTVTPEPSTWLLLGTGLLALGIVSRRMRRHE